MVIKYGLTLDDIIIQKSLVRITNQIYKLLPDREEGLNWQLPLDTILEELIGMNSLISMEKLFPLICKLEGLRFLTKDSDFVLYRRTIFECLHLLNEVVDDDNK